MFTIMLTWGEKNIVHVVSHDSLIASSVFCTIDHSTSYLHAKHVYSVLFVHAQIPACALLYNYIYAVRDAN